MTTDQDSNAEKPGGKAVRTPEELAILNEQTHAPPVNISYWTLFRYATTWDLIILMIGSICSIAGGAAMPLMTVSLETTRIAFGRLIHKLSSFS